MRETISYNDNAKGWTSFWNFFPGLFIRMNNQFYSVEKGQLWIHNDQNGPRNYFYGEKFNSKIITVINQEISSDKIFKTLVLEGNRSWHVKLRTNLTESSIEKSEFSKRESRQFAYIRKNENDTDFNGHTAQGVSTILSVVGSTITFGLVSDMINVGDDLFQINNGVDAFIGTITLIVNNVITVNAISNTPVVGLFCFAKKNARIEGSEIRGYYMEVELSNNDDEYVELFAVNTNAVKSYI